MSTPYYEILKDARGEWRWRFRGANHEIVASGEGYKSLASCEHAVSLLKASFSAPVNKL